jgi:hypothetical protein
MLVGSSVFLFGAAVGVPQVFTEPDPERRLQLLQARLRVWQLAQLPYAIGPLLAAVGAGLVVGSAGAALVAGALAWSWDVWLRGRRVPEFAHGLLPAWPFATYVLLTIAGLALLGLGLLASDFPTWLGWVVLGADALFAVAYVRFKDLPPFVFYLLLLLVGAVVG